MTDENRLPTNLQGLLRFAMHYTQSEDAPNASNWEEMDPERRKFLADALNSMTVNVIEEFENALCILDNSESSVSEQVEALTAIEDYVDNVDFAINFVKIGGSRILVRCLNSNSWEVRAAAASLVAEISQNNEYCQKHFVDINILPKLVELLSDDERVASKAMHALSCLVRSYEPALLALIEIGGLECILGCLGSGEEKLFVKACFLIATLSSEFNGVRDQLIKLGAIDQLADYVEVPEEYNPRLETLLNALKVLTDHSESISCNFSVELTDKLKKIITSTTGKPEFEEVLDYSKILLSRCAESSEDTDR